MRASSVAMAAAMLTIFVVMTGLGLGYPEGARFQPLVIGLPAIGLCVLQLVLDLRARGAPVNAPAPEQAALPSPLDVAAATVPLRRELIVWGYFLGLIAGVLLLGFWIAIPLFLVAFLRFEARAGWLASLGLGVGATAALYAVFGVVLRASLHQGFLVLWMKG